MKSKIYAISFANLILWAFHAQGMAAFNAIRSLGGKITPIHKIAFSKAMNKLQWTALAGDAIYKLGMAGKESMNVAKHIELLSDLDDFKRKYLYKVKVQSENPDRYQPNGNLKKVRAIPDTELDKINSSHVRTMFQDNSIAVKYSLHTGNAFSFKNIFTGKKYMILPDPAKAPIPEAVLHHEYAHVANDHNLKRAIVGIAGPLVMNTVFKGVSKGYDIIRYGSSTLKNTVPSIGASLLKIPATAFNYILIKVASAYQFRLQEQEADDAIPIELAEEGAKYVESAYKESLEEYEAAIKQYPSQPSYDKFLTNYPVLKDGLEKLFATHPPAHERAKILRERAAANSGQQKG